MGDRLDIHDRVLEAGSTEALMDAYDEWAEHYDADLVDGQGYVAPALAVEALCREVTPPARVLDAGCGTGLVGAALHARGFDGLVGLDCSEAMLARAEARGCYATLARADLTAPLAYATGSFDAVICVGTLTLGHVGPDSLHELARLVVSGGILCFTVRTQAWDAQPYAETLAALAAADVWRPISQARVDYIRGEGSTCELCLGRIAR